MNYLRRKKAGAARRKAWSRNAGAAHTRSLAPKHAASVSALKRELGEPVKAQPLPPWSPDFKLVIECARVSPDPRYLQVRCNGRDFGILSHTALATMVRKNLRRKTRTTAAG